MNSKSKVYTCNSLSEKAIDSKFVSNLLERTKRMHSKFTFDCQILPNIYSQKSLIELSQCSQPSFIGQRDSKTKVKIEMNVPIGNGTLVIFPAGISRHPFLLSQGNIDSNHSWMHRDPDGKI